MKKRVRRYEVDDYMGKTYRKEEFSFNRDDFNHLVFEFSTLLGDHLDEIYRDMKKDYTAHPDTKDIIDEKYLERECKVEEETDLGLITVTHPMYRRLFDGMLDYFSRYLWDKVTDDDIIRLITKDGSVFGGEVI